MSVTDDDDVLIIGFADAQFDTQHYLMFQRSLDEDESDEEIYIERDGQHQCIYGGIEKLMLFRNKALLNLNLETSGRLSVEQEVIVNFSVSDEKFIELVSGFEQLFSGKEILEIK
ncbi:MAG: Imm10 family immunity protein [Aridibacter sp.]